MKLDEQGRRLDDIGPALDGGKPVALAVSDHATFAMPGNRVHSSFIMDRRVIILSMPKHISMNAITTMSEDLINEIREAMETEYPTQ